MDWEEVRRSFVERLRKEENPCRIMNVSRPVDYQELLTEARKVDELWRIKADDLGYFTVNG